MNFLENVPRENVNKTIPEDIYSILIRDVGSGHLQQHVPERQDQLTEDLSG
jgi:hypothetical protein